MAKKKAGHAADPQSTPTAAPGGFVPASYQPGSKKGPGPLAGQPIVNGAAAQYSRNNIHYQAVRPGMSTGKKAAIVLLVVALLSGVGALGAYAYKEFQKGVINADLQLDKDEALKVEKELTQKEEEPTFDKPFTALLLGSDARADDPDMGARTDTIILVRVDPTVNKVSMVSIPRDTRIEIEGQGIQKFNAAYTFGGPSGTIAAVKELTGVDIDHYAEINFEGLVGLVDAIGGIDVVVDEEIDDEDAGGHIDKGEQHLDGEHALILARSRAYVDGDYTRQVNQRKVIMAIINRALTAPATELSGLIKASTKFLKTDSGIDFDFIYDLADQIRHNNDYPVEIYTATIPSSTANIDGVSYVVADSAGVAAMMKLFVAGEDVSEGVSESSIDEDIAAANGGQMPDGTYEGDAGAVGVSYYEESPYYVETTSTDEVYIDYDAGADGPIDYNATTTGQAEGDGYGVADDGLGGTTADATLEDGLAGEGAVDGAEADYETSPELYEEEYDTQNGGVDDGAVFEED